MSWRAQWISYAYDPRQDLGVFAFRNRLNLESPPEHLLVRVSADQRYKLLLNGELVWFGPQRGDLEHWFYDWIDLGPLLKAGENTLVALVWNFGWMAPMAQVSLRTGFMVDVYTPEDAEEHAAAGRLRTPGGWEVARVDGWGFDMLNNAVKNFYIDVGPGEILDGRQIPDWTTLASDTSLDWRTPHTVRAAAPRGTVFEPFWALIPRSIPAMRYDVRATPPVVRHGFIGDARPEAAEEPLPRNLELRPGEPVILDYQELLCAYPRLELTGPAGAEVLLTFAEGLWQTQPTKTGTYGNNQSKGNRNAVAGKEMRGYQDQIVLGEGVTRFEPLWWRTYRYLMVEVVAGDAADAGTVNVVSLDAVETGYPLAVKSTFVADDPVVQPIWDASVRTAERCAGETYFDCPYYEQLQYVGDTRIQALIGYYLGRDRQLQRNAIENFGWSMQDNGLTQSRYPNRVTQTIPPFSLWWVMMRHDQRMYDRIVEVDPADEDPIDSRGLDVANAFNALSGEELDRTFWNFGDWVTGWEHGVPPGGIRSTMHMLTLYHAHASTEIALERGGPAAKAKGEALYRYMSGQFERVKGLIKHGRDPEWKPSEHAEALWRLLQERLGVAPDPWPYAALEAAGAAPCTYYFSYYKHQAMKPDDYLSQLGPWREMIENGLTTFAENPEPVRSDCHAWSAHPILGFFQIVAGVTSAGHGWRRARIEPRPGSLRRFDARIAHLDGELRVAYENGRLNVATPVEAELVWQGRSAVLEPGTYSF
jgi:hypothetical protein